MHNNPTPTSNSALASQFGTAVMQQLPYEPTSEQLTLIAAMAHFVWRSQERSVMLLRGYAGTGKTSMMGAMVQALGGMGVKVVLMAPTGRAAKVLADSAGMPAHTIHRKIYQQGSFPEGAFTLRDNLHTRTLFIVDEASMVANDSGAGSVFGQGRLLDDLVQYCYNGKGCRLMLMGDDAQLPPVGQAGSPALQAQVLEAYGLHVYDVKLTQVARQARESGILHNATLLRQAITQGPVAAPVLQLAGYTDIQAVTGEFLLETLSDAIDRDGLEQTIVVTRSNRRASLFNQGIRNSILYREDELSSGDMVLVAKNNYFWTRDYEGIDFIANGDMLRVRRMRGEVEERYGLRFAQATLELVDHEGIEVDCKVILDCLASDAPALSAAQSERLYREVLDELPGNKRERFAALRQHPYYNALQLKWAYAVTAHKAQGGQWMNVFVDLGSIVPDALPSLDFHRWLYTAMTRARRSLWLVNSPLPTQD